MNLIADVTKKDSITYETIAPFAPKTIEFVGTIIPPVKNVFNTLEIWFEEFELNHTSDNPQ
jgi:hypothetical protein